MTQPTPTRRRGRPALPPDEARRSVLGVPLAEAERAALAAWSEREGRPVAALVRETALRAARRSSAGR